jgi:hypothetical protein
MAALESPISPTSPLAPKNGPPPPWIIWRPQAGPQKLLIDCPVGEIFFGGARGGGKTDGVLGKFAFKARRYGKAFNAVFFRKEMPQQDDLVERAKEIYCPLGAKWREQHKMFNMPQGGRVRFRPLESIQDAEKYQGQSITDAAVEEAGNYPMPAPIDRLNGVLRSAKGVPTQLILTGNPGGPGQGWIKDRYIDPAPLGLHLLERHLPNGSVHRYVFIPSKLQNNLILLRNDPGYLDRLYLVGSPQLVRAWLEGDWSAIEGAFFPEFSTERHVIAPVTIPAHWTRFRAMDWGSAKPFSVGWYAVAEGDMAPFPRGAIIKYREWYGSSGQPNVGLKLTAEEVAQGIVEREAPHECKYGVIDPSAYTADGGPSIAERMAKAGALFYRADNKRVGDKGALGGWDQLRARLKGEDKPLIYFFSTCKDTIRTLPMLQHDRVKAEDVDSDGEDHAGDETRYACMSRPYLSRQSKQVEPRFLDQMTADEMFWPKDRNKVRQERI